MIWLKRLIILALLAAIIFAGAKIIKNRKQEIASDKPPLAPVLAVRTALVKNGTLSQSALYRGIVQAEQEIELSPRIQGKIVWIKKEAGDRVKAQEVLVKIEDEEVKANIQALEARKKEIRSKIWLLKKDYKRHERLVKRDNLSKQTLDQTTSSLKQARARLEQVSNELKAARTRLEYTRLKTPFSGLIQERFQEPGDLALPGKSVLSLENPGAGYTVLIKVPPDLLQELEPECRIILKHKEKEIKTSLARVHPRADRDSALATLEAKVSDSPFDLPSGSSLKAWLKLQEIKGLILPEDAVLEQKNRAFVFVLNNKQQVRPVQVEIKRWGNEKVALKADLRPGQKVVLGPDSLLMRLGPGVKVSPLKEDLD